jgi:hypothetical protein
LTVSHTNLNSLTVTFNTVSSESVICTIGGVATTVTTVVANYPILATDNLLLVTGAYTLTLPDPTGLQGKTYSIKSLAANGVNIVVDTFGGIATIDGQLNQTIIAKYTTLVVFTDGSNWFII